MQGVGWGGVGWKEGGRGRGRGGGGKRGGRASRCGREGVALRSLKKAEERVKKGLSTYTGAAVQASSSSWQVHGLVGEY
jgi:hypothetical protein